MIVGLRRIRSVSIVYMALFEGETTAWEDIQIKLGNYAEREPRGPTLEECSRDVMEKAEGIAKQDFVNRILDKGEQELDDDLSLLRKARLEQLKRIDAQSVVRRITKESYMDEVTEGSKLAIIVVMMDRGGGSSFLESECKKFAREWISEIAPSKSCDDTTVRFYVGDIDELIGVSFPATSLPFAVIYSEGTCKSQLPNATINGIRNSLVPICKEARIRKSTTHAEEEDGLTKDIRRELQVRRAFDDCSSDDSDDVSDDERSRQRSKGYADMEFERNVLRFR